MFGSTGQNWHNIVGIRFCIFVEKKNKKNKYNKVCVLCVKPNSNKQQFVYFWPQLEEREEAGLSGCYNDMCVGSLFERRGSEKMQLILV